MTLLDVGSGRFSDHGCSPCSPLPEGAREHGWGAFREHGRSCPGLSMVRGIRRFSACAPRLGGERNVGIDRHRGCRSHAYEVPKRCAVWHRCRRSTWLLAGGLQLTRTPTQRIKSPLLLCQIGALTVSLCRFVRDSNDSGVGPCRWLTTCFVASEQPPSNHTERGHSTPGLPIDPVVDHRSAASVPAPAHQR
jgi:hypothetical protein